MERCPRPKLPAGWYQVCVGKALKKGASRRVDYLGRGFTLSRSDNGVVSIAEVTSSGRRLIPPEHVHEANGIIFLYFDLAGREPTWRVPVIPEYGQKGWSGWINFHWIVKTHIQELMENAVDKGHFPTVHKYFKAPNVNTFTWNGPTFNFNMDAPHKVFGSVQNNNLDLTAFALSLVMVKVTTRTLTLRVCDTVTPIDDDYVQLNTSVIFKKRNPLYDAAISIALPFEVKRYITSDHPILEAKGYYDRPVLCAEDGPIMKLRSWAQQFYPPTEA